MFCPKCGTPYSENDKFCTNCATRLDEVPSSVPEVAPVPQPEEVKAPEINPKPSIPSPVKPEICHVTTEDPIFDCEPKKKFKNAADITFAEVKRLASSPAMIVMTIMFTLGLIYSIASVNTYSIANILTNSQFGRILYDLDLYEILYSSSGVLSELSVVINMPSILYCICMWIVLSSALDKSNKKIITGALTLVKAVVIVTFIVLLLIATAIIILMFEAFNTFYGMQAFVACMIPIGALVIMILYYVCILSTLSSIKDAAVHGIANTGISGFLIFCCYFSGIVTIVFSLTDLTTLPAGIAVLSCGVLLKNYKRAMKTIEHKSKQYIQQ